MPIRIYIYIDEALDQRLRQYIHARFRGHVHGGITEVVCEALRRFLDQEEKIYIEKEGGDCGGQEKVQV